MGWLGSERLMLYQVPDIARITPTSSVEKLKPPYFLGLTAHNENICRRRINCHIQVVRLLSASKLLNKRRTERIVGKVTFFSVYEAGISSLNSSSNYMCRWPKFFQLFKYVTHSFDSSLTKIKWIAIHPAED